MRKFFVGVWNYIRPMFRPHFDLYVGVGFADVQVRLFYELIELNCREYVGLRLRFLQAEWRFRLYTPYHALKEK